MESQPGIAKCHYINMQSSQPANLHKPFVSLIALSGQKWKKKSGRWITILFNSRFSFSPAPLRVGFGAGNFQLNRSTPVPASHTHVSIRLCAPLSLSTDPTLNNQGFEPREDPQRGGRWWQNGGMEAGWSPASPRSKGTSDSELWFWGPED